MSEVKVDVVEIEIDEEKRIINIIATPYKEYPGDQLKIGERPPIWKSFSIVDMEKKEVKKLIGSRK